MNKTNGIRLFFIVVTIAGILSFRTSYYFFHEEEEKEEITSEAEQSTISENTENTIIADSKKDAKEDAIPIMKEEEPFQYLISEKDGELVIYESDGQTVFLNTGIHINELEEERKEEIRQGKKVYSLDDLYAILESYTS